MEEDKGDESRVFEIGGANPKIFNLESELHHKISRSEYFKSLAALTTFSKVVDVVYRLESVAPWTFRGQQKRGYWKSPSSAFCLLLKLFHLQLTVAQVRSLLDHADSPYIRALGMLFVRYGAPPRSLWRWLGPYLDDREEFAPHGPESSCAMGDFVLQLLTTTEPFYETELPVVAPVALGRRMLRRVELHGEMMARARRNQNFLGTDKLRKNSRGFLCCALSFYDDEIDDDLDQAPALLWRTDGVIETVDDLYSGAYPTFRVKFDQDGRTALAKLGMIEFPKDDEDEETKERVLQAVQQVLKKKESRPPPSESSDADNSSGDSFGRYRPRRVSVSTSPSDDRSRHTESRRRSPEAHRSFRGRRLDGDDLARSALINPRNSRTDWQSLHRRAPRRFVRVRSRERTTRLPPPPP